MSQSATIYQVTQSCFVKLREANGRGPFDPHLALSRATFQGTHCGLEYLLCQAAPADGDLVKGIFSPEDRLGPQFAPDDVDVFLAALEEGSIIPFIPPEKVSKLSSLLHSFAEQHWIEKYHPQRMNEAGVYPGIWSADHGNTSAFDKRHLVHDFEQLREIISEAAARNDYLLVFVG